MGDEPRRPGGVSKGPRMPGAQASLLDGVDPCGSRASISLPAQLHAPQRRARRRTLTPDGATSWGGCVVGLQYPRWGTPGGALPVGTPPRRPLIAPRSRNQVMPPDREGDRVRALLVRARHHRTCGLKHVGRRGCRRPRRSPSSCGCSATSRASTSRKLRASRVMPHRGCSVRSPAWRNEDGHREPAPGVGGDRNNVQLKGDLGRRVVPIDLDPKIEHPEDRTFKRSDLLGYLQENRPRLCACIR